MNNINKELNEVVSKAASELNYLVEESVKYQLSRILNQMIISGDIFIKTEGFKSSLFSNKLKLEKSCDVNYLPYKKVGELQTQLQEKDDLIKSLEGILLEVGQGTHTSEKLHKWYCDKTKSP